MTDTLTALQQHGAYVARSLFNAAKTTRQSAVIATRGSGNIVTPVTFDTPFLNERPIVNTGYVLLSGYDPSIPVSPDVADTVNLTTILLAGEYGVTYYNSGESDGPTPGGLEWALRRFLRGIIVSVGVRSWVTKTDGQGNTVYTGANVLIFVSSLTGQAGSHADFGVNVPSPTSYITTIEHHIVFEGLSYNPVPQDVSGGGNA
jgi:hypothetical protein